MDLGALLDSSSKHGKYMTPGNIPEVFLDIKFETRALNEPN